MQNVIPVGVKRNTTRLELPITSAWGGAGALVGDSTDSTAVTLSNIGNFPFEYQLDAGDWTRLELRNLIVLNISLASTAIHLRKSEFGGEALARLDIDNLTDDFFANGAPVDLGGPGGATAFTDLTDAPGTITANALMVGNPTGEALAFVGSIKVATGGEGDPTAINMTRTDGAGCRFYGENYADSEFNYPGSDATLQADTSDALLTLYAYDAEGHGCGFEIHVQSDGVIEFKNDSSVDGTLKLTNFDVTATDLTATMTVDAVQYSIAKAIKVKIGTDTYFWPCFGPVAP